MDEHGSQAITRRVEAPDPQFGWAWVGVLALAVVGVSAVVHGRRHENEHRQRRQPKGGGRNHRCPCCGGGA